jgi:hypothetical protein
VQTGVTAFADRRTEQFRVEVHQDGRAQLGGNVSSATDNGDPVAHRDLDQHLGDLI